MSYCCPLHCIVFYSVRSWQVELYSNLIRPLHRGALWPFLFRWIYYCHKGQIKPKADWKVVNSPKKWTNNLFFVFTFLLFTTKKTQIRSLVFLENLERANLFTVFIWPLAYRISANSFPPWIVSAPVCTVIKGHNT